MSFLKEYTLLGELGKGGFAKVYKVRHDKLGYIRAIRVLNEPVTEERSRTYQNFLRECKVLLRLGNGNHRNIVHIYQPRLLENHALVEMDFVDGQDISKYLNDNKKFLPVEEVIRMVEEMSGALSYCHEDIYKFCIDPDEDGLVNDPIDGTKWLIDEPTRKKLINKYKVIHNDIHSGNIMRREDGSFVLLDFGLAITGNDDVRNSSRHENGAVEFKAPEKWENDEILTEQSDIYSLGIVMYEYLAGRVPFPFDKSNSNKIKAEFMLGEAHKTQSPPPIHVIRKAFFEAKYPGKTYQIDYPDWLESAIMRCLEKDPGKRFKNGKELNEYITKHLHDDAITKEYVQSLTNEITSLKDDRKQLMGEIGTLNKKENDLTRYVNETKYHLKLANETIENLKRDKDRYNDQLDQTIREKQKLEEEIKNIKAKPGRRTKTLPIVLCIFFGLVATALGVLYANSQGRNNIPDDYYYLQMENDELKTTNEKLLSQKNTLEKQVTDQNAEIKDLNTKKTTSTTRETELETQLSQANVTISSLEKERNTLKNQVSEQNAEIKDLKNKKSAPSSRETELETQLSQANATISSLEKERNTLKKERNNYKSERDKLQTEVNALRKNL